METMSHPVVSLLPPSALTEDDSYLDGLCDHAADKVHETQVCVAVSDQSSSGQRHAWFLWKQEEEKTIQSSATLCRDGCGARGQRSDLQAVQPVPSVGGVSDREQLQDSDEHVGVVVRQRTRQQAVCVVQVDVEAAAQTQHETTGRQTEEKTHVF